MTLRQKLAQQLGFSLGTPVETRLVTDEEIREANRTRRVGEEMSKDVSREWCTEHRTYITNCVCGMGEESMIEMERRTH